MENKKPQQQSGPIPRAALQLKRNLANPIRTN